MLFPSKDAASEYQLSGTFFLTFFLRLKFTRKNDLLLPSVILYLRLLYGLLIFFFFLNVSLSSMTGRRHQQN
jgi:hypothetical protein